MSCCHEFLDQCSLDIVLSLFTQPSNMTAAPRRPLYHITRYIDVVPYLLSGHDYG